MRIIVDSSIYIDWLKRRENFIAGLLSYLAKDELLVCGIIRFEVLRGIIHAGQRNQMAELFSLAIDIPLS
jgi:predicted nucleic acid-binding protein